MTDNNQKLTVLRNVEVGDTEILVGGGWDIINRRTFININGQDVRVLRRSLKNGSTGVLTLSAKTTAAIPAGARLNVVQYDDVESTNAIDLLVAEDAAEGAKTVTVNGLLTVLADGYPVSGAGVAPNTRITASEVTEGESGIIETATPTLDTTYAATDMAGSATATGGTGTDATFTVTSDTGYLPDAATLGVGGTGFKADDVLTVAAGSIKVSTVDGTSGAVETFVFTPSTTVSTTDVAGTEAATGGSGKGATFVITSKKVYKPASVVIAAGGTGYSAGDVLTVANVGTVTVDTVGSTDSVSELTLSTALTAAVAAGSTLVAEETITNYVPVATQEFVVVTAADAGATTLSVDHTTGNFAGATVVGEGIEPETTVASLTNADAFSGTSLTVGSVFEDYQPKAGDILLATNVYPVQVLKPTSIIYGNGTRAVTQIVNEQ